MTRILNAAANAIGELVAALVFVSLRRREKRGWGL